LGVQAGGWLVATNDQAMENHHFTGHGNRWITGLNLREPFSMAMSAMLNYRKGPMIRKIYTWVCPKVGYLQYLMVRNMAIWGKTPIFKHSQN
jgi:hypothetical protein